MYNDIESQDLVSHCLKKEIRVRCEIYLKKIACGFYST